MEDAKIGGAEQSQADGKGNAAAKAWPDDTIMTVAFIGLGAVVFCGWYLPQRSPSPGWPIVLASPFLCLWLYGIFATRTTEGRILTLAYGLFSTLVSWYAANDVYGSRCASSVMFVFLFVMTPSMVLLLFGFARVLWERWTQRSAAAKE